MRKLLLASVAVLGASMGMADTAVAQDAVDYTGQAFPTAGTVTVRLNGRFRFYAGAMDNGAARTTNSPNTFNPVGGGTNKISSYGVFDYARLFPGFDGVATNGLKYGSSLEIRQDNGVGAGGGTLGSISGRSNTRNALYFRRLWGYLGTDQFGTVRVGSADNPGSLYLTGTFENFNDGGLNGDAPAFLLGNVGINWPFADVGNIYTTTKIVYLSPQFAGFDFGVSFEPTTANGGGPGGPGSAGATNDFLSSTSTGDYTRRKNTYEGLLRYRGTFGPVGLAATGSYTGSGRVLDSGVPGATINPQRSRLEDLSVADFGAAATIGGFSFGGNYQVGRYNVPGGGGFGGLLARGQSNSSALIVGASYTIGPIIVGAHALKSFSQGDQLTATNRSLTGAPLALGGVVGGQRVESGIAAGGTYSLAPGVSLFASYLYSERKQNGFNFVTGTSNNANNNKVNGQVFSIGSSFAY